MTLIKSISGIRGTIGGAAGDNLTPIDIVKFTCSFVKLLKRNKPAGAPLRIVVGRDARLSGGMVNNMVCGTLQSVGADVFDIGLSTTPTTELAVTGLNADGGIIITASHNPMQWNALKLLNEKGEFISASEGEWLLAEAEKNEFDFADIDNIGGYNLVEGWIDQHIKKVLDLPLVNKNVIEKANFKVAVDAVNSTGGIAIPRLLKALGVKQVMELNCEPTGRFAHTPEPLAENLTEICRFVKQNGCDLGIVVDPDVDRLVFVKEDGELFGEEYTLVSVADYILNHTKGNTVSNLSSTRALSDVTQKHGCQYFASAVGEVNVVEKMKEVNAVIGGEGNGGVIYPELHYGRDALVGTALFLTQLAEKQIKCSELKHEYPQYFMSKNKISLTPQTDVDSLLNKIAQHFKSERVTTIDGVKIDFDEGWVHLRKSNTEPIIRVYSEGSTVKKANELAENMLRLANEII